MNVYWFRPWVGNKFPWLYEFLVCRVSHVLLVFHIITKGRVCCTCSSAVCGR
uniref:Uncharacterized protein n=1 Tax=Papilio xuthus TaxID=66420 RepID=I4DLR9_PAPXU|nr:unknown unsecreted protein [Papilio xuthus]